MDNSSSDARRAGIKRTSWYGIVAIRSAKVAGNGQSVGGSITLINLTRNRIPTELMMLWDYEYDQDKSRSVCAYFEIRPDDKLVAT
jgi:hypothetical protein